MLLAPGDVDSVRETIAARLRAAEGTLEGRVRPHQVLAWIADPQRRAWSPSIDLNLRRHPKGTLVVGLVAPHPALMTAYVFLGIGLGFLLSIALTWSFVQWSMGETPLCLVGAAGAAAGLVGVLMSRTVGIAWAKPQIPALVTLVDGFGDPRDDELQLLSEALETLHPAHAPTPSP